MSTSQSEISTPLSLILMPTNNLLPGVSPSADIDDASSGSFAAGTTASALTLGVVAGCGSRVCGGVGVDARTAAPLGALMGMLPGRGGGPSTVFTEGCTSTDPSRRPIPSIAISFGVLSLNDNVIIRLPGRSCNGKRTPAGIRRWEVVEKQRHPVSARCFDRHARRAYFGLAGSPAGRVLRTGRMADAYRSQENMHGHGEIRFH